jgi:hypothetical protein
MAIRASAAHDLNKFNSLMGFVGDVEKKYASLEAD